LSYTLNIDSSLIESAQENLQEAAHELASSIGVDGAMLSILGASSQAEVEKIILEVVCPRLNADPAKCKVTRQPLAFQPAMSCL